MISLYPVKVGGYAKRRDFGAERQKTKLSAMHSLVFSRLAFGEFHDGFTAGGLWEHIDGLNVIHAPIFGELHQVTG